MRIVPVLVGVAVLLGGAEAGSAMIGGSHFASRMRALNGTDLGSPQLRLENVQVHRGLFSSSATADIEVLGIKPISVPLELQASQGLRPNGSALRVGVTLGAISDPQVQALLAKLHDPEPMRAQLDYGLTGKLKVVTISMAPVHAVLDAQGTRIDWPGAQGVIHPNGYFDKGGTADGSMHWSAVQVALPKPVGGQLHVGELVETFDQTGRMTNSTGHLAMRLGPTYATGNAQAFRFDGFQVSMQYALHRKESGYSDNPSGLPVGQIQIKDLQLKAGISQPVAGQVQATANLRMPDVGSVILPGMTPQQIEAANLQLLTQIQGSAQLRVSMSLYRKFENPALQRLAAAGLIEQQGQDAVSNIAMSAGHITINGHALGS